MATRSQRILGAFVTAAALLVGRLARAGDDAATREAKARFAEGIAHVKAEDFEAARMSFAQAYTVLHKADILWNLALAEEKSAHTLDALAHFKQLTRDALTALDRANAQRHADALSAVTGHVDVQAPAGTLLVLDGQALGTAPMADVLDVMPGRHVIDGRLPEGTKSVTVDARAGQVERATFEAAASVPASGLSPSGANASENSRSNATAPGLPIGPAAPTGPTGSTTTTATTTTITTTTTTGTTTPTPKPPVTAGAPETAETPVPSKSAHIITTAALAAGAAIAVGVGAYYGVQSQQEGNVAAGYRARYPSDYCVNGANAGCAAWNSAVQQQNQDATASNVLYVAGGTLAVGAVLAWFVWPKQTEAETKAAKAAWVLPAAEPRGGGVVIGAGF